MAAALIIESRDRFGERKENFCCQIECNTSRDYGEFAETTLRYYRTLDPSIASVSFRTGEQVLGISQWQIENDYQLS